MTKEKRTFMGVAPKPGYKLKSEKIGRNQPCPCGSGKKAKHCCGCQTQYSGTPC